MKQYGVQSLWKFEISSKLPALNRTWVLEELREFAGKHELEEGYWHVHFTQIPKHGSIVHCSSRMYSGSVEVYVTGSGRDEYEALRDCLEKSEILLVKENEKQLEFMITDRRAMMY